MLMHVDTERDCAQVIQGKAHIVVVLDAQGRASLRGYFSGRHDSTYAVMDDARLGREITKLLGELRDQLSPVTS